MSRAYCDSTNSSWSLACGNHSAALLLLLCVLTVACSHDAERAVDAETLASLPVPPALERGATLFDARCSPCHGTFALGTEQGPALLHATYRSAHHGDEAFQLAVARGVRAHHWRFGDMAPVAGLTRADVTDITAYIRWLQRAARIE